jgi:hypothetical protein
MVQIIKEIVMNNEEEQYCLEKSFNDSRRVLSAMKDKDTLFMFTDTELAHVASNAVTENTVKTVAYLLAMSKKDIAKELYDELSYYLR